MTSSLLSVYSIILPIFSAVLQENTSEENALFSLSKPSDQAVSKLVDRHVSARVCLNHIKLSQDINEHQNSITAKNKSCFVYSSGIKEREVKQQLFLNGQKAVIAA